MQTHSGKFVVRVSRSLHASIKRDAEVQGKSLNDLCIRRLSLTSMLETLPLDISNAVAFVVALSKGRLKGIVIFGSWARGDNSDLSDVDILVVMSRGTKITRDLYHEWERGFSSPTKIEPHFVQLPDFQQRVSGLWAEIAMDGLILCDRDLEISRYLAHVRRLIGAGKIVVKRSHGQNYWVQIGVA